MDATLSESPGFAVRPGGILPQARLPGEDNGATDDKLRAPIPEAGERPVGQPDRERPRGTLMSSVGIIFLVMAIVAMGYAQRAELERIPLAYRVLAQRHVLPNPTQVAIAVNASPGVHAMTSQAHLGPPMSDGTVHIPPHGDGAAPQKSPVTPVSTKLAAVSPPPAVPAQGPVVSPAPPLSSAQAQLQQFDALQLAATAIPHVTVSAPPPRSAPVPSRTAPSPAKVARAMVSTPPAPLAPPAKLIPQSPAAQAIALTAAPMTDQDQLDVLHLVTQLGILVRDQRDEIAVLQGQVDGLSDRVNTQLTDFDQRLSLAEAKGAIDAAMEAGGSQSAAQLIPASPDAAPSSVTTPAPQTTPPPAPLVRSVSDYHIQAASPGLALVSTADDGGQSFQVGVGDMVPGVGHVTSISQNGTNWIVQTDHGAIQ